MILRDGRGVVHDLGPRKLHGNEIAHLASMREFRPMPEGASWRDEKSRQWLHSTRQTPEARREKDRAYRAADLEHHRELERERARRYRARKAA